MGNAKRIAALIVGMWQSKLRDNYDDDFEAWQHYSDMYGLAERLGFRSAEEAWEANPTIQGSTDPRDFKVVGRANFKRLVGRYTGPDEDYFTPEQRARVDEVLAGLRNQVGETINREAPGIKGMAPEGLPYVAQGMLEELIEELSELV